MTVSIPPVPEVELPKRPPPVAPLPNRPPPAEEAGVPNKLLVAAPEIIKHTDARNIGTILHAASATIN